MAWLPLSLCLLGTSLCGAVSKQDLVLDQPQAVRALRGASVTLTCSCNICNYVDFHSEWRFTSRNGDLVTVVAVKTSVASKPLDSQYKFALTHQRNSRSLLLIKNLQLNDQGTYLCTMIKNVPPPTVVLNGPGTQLEVYALPNIWFFSSPSEAALHMSLVTCAVRDFYPEVLNITLSTTCGEYEVLDDNTSTVVTSNGTFSVTVRAWVNATNCQNEMEVTCLARQPADETCRTLWIPREKNKAVPVVLIRFIVGGAVVLWLIFLLGFLRRSSQTYYWCLSPSENIGS